MSLPDNERRTLKKKLIVFALAAVLTCVAAAAQIKPKTDEQAAIRPVKPLQHEVGVALKLVQVVVTDKDGKPVTDLKKEDFVLTDNGQAQTLTEFERHVLNLPGEEAGVAAPAEEKPALAPQAGRPPLLARKLFLVFDFGNSTPQGIRKAVEAARGFLETGLHPTDEVAVLSYSLLARLKVHEFLTTDHARARKVVAGFGLGDALGTLAEEAEVYQADLAAGGVADARPELDMSFAGSGESAKRASAGQSVQSDARTQAKNYIFRLTALAQALRYEPGQKTFILLSCGLPGSLIYKKEGGFRDPLNTDLQNAYEDLCKELAASNVVVYPIDLAPPTAASSSERGPVTLERMAVMTGGRFLGNVDNAADHFRRVQMLTGAFYVLGFPVSGAWDGKFHRLKVSVARPGLEVHAQAGYYNPKPFRDYNRLERDLDLVDLALAEKPLTQTPLRLPMTSVLTGLRSRGGFGGGDLCLIARLPLKEMRERWTGGPVEVVGLVYDRNDAIAASVREEWRIAAATPGTEFTYLNARMTVPPGAYRCRVVVRDLETGSAAVGGAAVVVPAPVEGIRLFPPLFLLPEKGAGSLVLGKPRSAGDLFDPAQYAPHLEAAFGAGTTTWAAIRCFVPAGAAGEIVLSASLFDAQTGEEIKVPLEATAKGREGDLFSWFVRFDIPDLEPDTYRLTIQAAGPDGKVSRLTRDIEIDRPSAGQER
jgi:VWFA-related protein